MVASVKHRHGVRKRPKNLLRPARKHGRVSAQLAQRPSYVREQVSDRV